MIRPTIACFRAPPIIAWCDQVTVAPERSKISVFKKGISQQLKGSIPFGGQIAPTSIVGERLEWKKAQKKAKKNITSETMNRNIP